ncbi:MAG: ATP-binding cassette domain-containing protein [Bacteroidota bacterium]|nr:ATP-binding cassette domain-containing protein [Bacteroidota bacterium]|tara:strand:+ start:414 stop:1088 length:675 start_codon:yes stop_codon:yes gene_type:complete
MSLISIESLNIELSGKKILTDVNLNIEKGGMTFLIGKTGSGKTTLIKSLYGDISIKNSNVFEIVNFNLREIKDYQIPFLRRKIGIVFQDFKLLDDRSIFKNLEFVLKATGWSDNKKIEDRILEVLHMVGIEINLDTYPSKLSGGEQQRIAIARALLNNPELIIADEPTGNLDPETSVEIISLFEKLNNLGITMIIATHDYNLILKLPGKIYKCENKKLFEVVRK